MSKERVDSELRSARAIRPPAELRDRILSVAATGNARGSRPVERSSWLACAAAALIGFGGVVGFAARFVERGRDVERTYEVERAVRQVDRSFRSLRGDGSILARDVFGEDRLLGELRSREQRK